MKSRYAKYTPAIVRNDSPHTKTFLTQTTHIILSESISNNFLTRHIYDPSEEERDKLA